MHRPLAGKSVLKKFITFFPPICNDPYGLSSTIHAAPGGFPRQLHADFLCLYRDEASPSQSPCSNGCYLPSCEIQDHFFSSTRKVWQGRMNIDSLNRAHYPSLEPSRRRGTMMLHTKLQGGHLSCTCSPCLAERS